MFTFKTNIHKDGETLVTIDTGNDSMEMSVEKITKDDITKIENMLQQNINTVCNVLRQETKPIDKAREKPAAASGFQMPAGSAQCRKIYTVADWLNG